MDTRLKTLRITQFKGLNKSTNPHNIDDAEFTDMVNVELSENRTLQSRMGFVKVIDHIDVLVPSILGIYKADWNNWTSTLYSARAWALAKNNETTGYDYFHTVLPNPTQKAVHFQRWHDKLLMLAQGESLMWMGSTEGLSAVVYPQMQLESASVSTSAGGSLADTAGYQYNISLLLGDNYRDGETPGALPIASQTIPPYDTKYPPPGPDWLPERYLQDSTTSADRTIVFTNATYSGQLHGFDISALKLFRRKCTVSAGETPEQDTYIGDTSWVLIDTVYIKKESGDTSVYSLSGDMSVNNIIRSITGTYNSTDDSATLILGITDDGTVEYDAGQSPTHASNFSIPKAKFMARVNNRIFLGNIVGSDPRDKKTVRFTYTGYLDPQATIEEIENFHYGFPMLIFGPYSWFYCDHEDTDDEITGLYGYRNSLIIFTGKCTFMWQEGMADPVKVSNDVGCIAPETIREFEGRLIWLSTNGVVMYDGSKLKNLSAEKANSYILGLSKAYAYKACAAIFNRRYYIAAPFGGSSYNDTVLVYDFDLDEWAERTYRILDSSTHFYIDCFYKYSDGAKETLYVGGHSDAPTPLCYIVKLDEGYDDGGADIGCSLKTKYYDFGAPDIIKDTRAFNLDITNRNAGTLTIDMYLDNLNEAAYSFTYSGSDTGFLLNSATQGRLNVDSIVNITDEMFAFSIPIGKHASRVQFGLEFNAGSNQTAIHAISFDWRVVRKLQRKYGA